MSKVETIHAVYYCDVCGKSISDPVLPEVWMRDRNKNIHSLDADKDICFDCLVVLQDAELMGLIYLPRDISLKGKENEYVRK